MNEIERAYYISEIYLPNEAKKKQEAKQKKKDRKHLIIEILINLGCTIIGFILGKLC